MNDTAPDVFQARFETNVGDFVIEVHRAWSPHGADRFYNLLSAGYYDGVRFFRVVEDFVAQIGIHGDPEISAAWRPMQIPDDSVMQSNTRGFVTYAKGEANSRTTQIFINYIDNSRLDTLGFSPFGEVVEGMEVVDDLHSGYREDVEQPRVHREGERYMRVEFPRLSYVIRARIVEAVE